MLASSYYYSKMKTRILIAGLLLIMICSCQKNDTSRLEGKWAVVGKALYSEIYITDCSLSGFSEGLSYMPPSSYELFGDTLLDDNGIKSHVVFENDSTLRISNKYERLKLYRLHSSVPAYEELVNNYEDPYDQEIYGPFVTAFLKRLCRFKVRHGYMGKDEIYKYDFDSVFMDWKNPTFH